jgi:hypothetical protein
MVGIFHIFLAYHRISDYFCVFSLAKSPNVVTVGSTQVYRIVISGLLP